VVFSSNEFPVMSRMARPNRMRISSGIAPHLGGHQPMRTHPISHIVVDGDEAREPEFASP
jgi:hypothetical protein